MSEQDERPLHETQPKQIVQLREMLIPGFREKMAGHQCVTCEKHYTAEQIARWSEREAHEFTCISGICPECWAELFSETCE